MIKKVEIKYFRNINYATYEFNTLTTVLAGENKLGKSNTLNAIVWCLTDTIYTDNLGVGENDIDSVIPKDYQKGQNTEVSIWVDDVKLTKIYRSTYQRGTNIINGHTTDYKINDAVSDRKEFVSTLSKVFNYHPYFTEFTIKEINMLVDPLFLAKVDAKLLRKVLGALGCNVSNEEIYALGYEDLRPYESQYLGNFVKMKQDYTKRRTEATKEMEVSEKLALTYGDIEGTTFDYERQLQVLNDEKEKIVIKRNNLAQGDIQKEIDTLENEINIERVKYRNSIQLQNQELGAQIKELENNLLNIQSTRKNELNAQIKPLEDESRALENEIISLRKDIKILNTQIAAGKDKIQSQIRMGQGYQSQINTYSNKLIEIQNKQFNSWVVCPDCGKQFTPNPEEFKIFEYNKQRDIEYFKNQIQDLQTKIAKIKPELVEIDAQIKLAQNEKSNIETQIQTKDMRFNELKTQIASLSMQGFDNSEETKIKNQIEQLKSDRIQLSYLHEENSTEVYNLIVKKNELIEKQNESINAALTELEATQLEVDKKISELYMTLSKCKSRDEANARYEQSVQALNDINFVLGRVTDFLHEMVRKMNAKASDLFDGIDFVLLEENLTNDGLTDVCYVTVDGIQFKDLSTSQKIVAGCKFIDGLRKKIGQNQLPILADKLEAFDHLEKVATLSEYQLLGTKADVYDNIKVIEL